MTRNTLLALVAATFALVLPLIATAQDAPRSPKVLIITGDHGHKWKETTPYLKELLTKAGLTVEVTETPAKDLTPDNLAKHDVLLLNYKDTKAATPDTTWTDANKKAFKDAVEGGKGLVVYHHASSAFVSGDEWSKEFETITAGGWRKQGHHGKRHEFDVTVGKDSDHPIIRGLAGTYPHSNDELYQNSLVPEGAAVLATAWSEPTKDPKNTAKHEPMLWTTTYGKGRVVNTALGHDVPAMQSSPIFQTLLTRSVEWAATGEAKTPAPAELKPTTAAAR